MAYLGKKFFWTLVDKSEFIFTQNSFHTLESATHNTVKYKSFSCLLVK